MDRYSLLLILNLPIVIFGIARATSMYQQLGINRTSLALRLSFWVAILLSLVFSHRLYEYLYSNGLVQSPALGIPTIILATGILFCFFLCIRIYTRLEIIEKRQSDLLTKLAILMSENDPIE